MRSCLAGAKIGCPQIGQENGCPQIGQENGCPQIGQRIGLSADRAKKLVARRSSKGRLFDSVAGVGVKVSSKD